MIQYKTKNNGSSLKKGRASPAPFLIFISVFVILPAEAYLAPRAFPFSQFGRTGLRPRHGLLEISRWGRNRPTVRRTFRGKEKRTPPLFSFPQKGFRFHRQSQVCFSRKNLKVRFPAWAVHFGGGFQGATGRDAKRSGRLFGLVSENCFEQKSPRTGDRSSRRLRVIPRSQDQRPV